MTGYVNAGEVIHYYNKIGVAVLHLTQGLSVGDQVHFRGAHTDFDQQVESMQVEHEQIESASAGDEVAIKVGDRVRVGDEVILLAAED
jgi:translation elongation factor EF-1alpha